MAAMPTDIEKIDIRQIGRLLVGQGEYDNDVASIPRELFAIRGGTIPDGTNQPIVVLVWGATPFHSTSTNSFRLEERNHTLILRGIAGTSNHFVRTGMSATHSKHAPSQ